MGIFHELMEVVNRAPWPLSIRFDGSEMTLKPGKSFIPRQCWGYALNQNPIMGSHDAFNPHIQGARYLIGDPARPEKYPCDKLTKEEIEMQTNNPSRFDYVELMSERLGKREHIEVKGRKPVHRSEIAEASMVGTDRND